MADQPVRGERTSTERIATVEEKIKSLIRELDIREQNSASRHADNIVRLDAIYDQALKTNGRVGSLESWRDKIKGAWIVVGIIGTALGFAARELIGKLLH